MSIAYRERPQCRKVIISQGLRPHFDAQGNWKGRKALCPDGSTTWISDGLRIEMKKMLQEGFWGRPEAALADGCGLAFRSGPQSASREVLHLRADDLRRHIGEA